MRRPRQEVKNYSLRQATMPTLQVRKRSRPPTPVPVPVGPQTGPPSSAAVAYPPGGAVSESEPAEGERWPLGGDSADTVAAPPVTATATTTATSTTMGAGGGGRPPLRAPPPSSSSSAVPRKDNGDDGEEEDDDRDDAIARNSAGGEEEDAPDAQLRRQRASRRERVKKKLRRKLHHSGVSLKSNLRRAPSPLMSMGRGAAAGDGAGVGVGDGSEDVTETGGGERTVSTISDEVASDCAVAADANEAARGKSSSKYRRWNRRHHTRAHGTSSPHPVVVDERAEASSSSACASAIPPDLSPQASCSTEADSSSKTGEGGKLPAVRSTPLVAANGGDDNFEIGLGGETNGGAPQLRKSLRRNSYSCLGELLRGEEEDGDEERGIGRDDGEDEDEDYLRAVLSDDCDDRMSLRRRRRSRMMVVDATGSDGGRETRTSSASDDDVGALMEEMLRASGGGDDMGQADARADGEDPISPATSGFRRRRQGPHLGKRRSHRRKYRVRRLPSSSPTPLTVASPASDGDGDETSRSTPEEAAPTADFEPSEPVSLPAEDTVAAAASPEEAPSESSSFLAPLQSSGRFASAPPVTQGGPLPRASLTWAASTSAATVTTVSTNDSSGSGGGTSCGQSWGTSVGSRSSKSGAGSGKERRVKVKPQSAYGKTYMTEEELVGEMMRPSAVFEDPTTGGTLAVGRRKETGVTRRRWSNGYRSVSMDAATSIPGEVSLEARGKNSPLEDGDEGYSADPADRSGFNLNNRTNDDDDGRIGTLSVEVMSCVGLPKFDRFSKPDVRVYALLADSAFATDVIPSCRSPLWPSRCRRAASFPVHHAYARLYVGVFGVRSGSTRKEKENDDFAGRVAIDVSALRPGTEYDATMPLRSSTSVYDRRPRGAVRLRLSLEWRSERAAVLSYLKAPTRSTGGESGFGDGGGGAGHLAIPCGDTKTFRNVALTVHGEHLPGKYERRAFRATTREAALYQIQIRHVAKVLANDAVTYERPLVSLYLFAAWMHCVYQNSVALVPSYAVGYLLFLFMNNYVAFHLDPDRHAGYQSVNITEILRALIHGRTGGDDSKREPAMRPVAVERTETSDYDVHGPGFGGPLENPRMAVDHAEFPFSQRHAYPKSGIRDAVAPHSNRSSSSADRISSRVTMYSSMETISSDLGSQFATEHDWATGNKLRGEKNDDDSIGTDESDIDLDFDSDEDEDEDEDADEVADSLVAGTHRSLFVFSSDPTGRSIPVGPQQDVDTIMKRVPFKQNLAKFENRFHDLTLRLFDDRVSGGPSILQRQRIEPSQQGDGDGKKKERKKKSADEFDRRLGLRSGKQNPLLALTAGYLGPVMNMVRIWLSVVRVSFNVAAWTDPFLSFWVLCFLLVLAAVLAVFPWRAFMLLSGIVLLGPQNVVFKRIARNRGNLSADENATKSDESVSVAEPPSVAADVPDAQEESIVEPRESKKGNRRKFRITRKEKKKHTLPEKGPATDEQGPGDKILAFSTQQKLKKNVPPRGVIIPYSRLRKERFYDWPPDPSVSRATPLAKKISFDQVNLPIPDEIPCGSMVPKENGSNVGLRKRLYTK